MFLEVPYYWQDTFIYSIRALPTARVPLAKQYEITVEQTGYRFKDVIYTKVPSVKWFLLYIECILDLGTVNTL